MNRKHTISMAENGFLQGSELYPNLPSSSVSADGQNTPRERIIRSFDIGLSSEDDKSGLNKSRKAKDFTTRSNSQYEGSDFEGIDYIQLPHSRDINNIGQLSLECINEPSASSHLPELKSKPHLYRSLSTKSSLPPVHQGCSSPTVLQQDRPLSSIGKRSISCPSFSKDPSGLTLPLSCISNQKFTSNSTSSNSSQQNVSRRASSRSMRHVNSQDQLSSRHSGYQEYLHKAKTNDQQRFSSGASYEYLPDNDQVFWAAGGDSSDVMDVNLTGEQINDLPIPVDAYQTFPDIFENETEEDAFVFDKSNNKNKAIHQQSHGNESTNTRELLPKDINRNSQRYCNGFTQDQTPTPSQVVNIADVPVHVAKKLFSEQVPDIGDVDKKCELWLNALNGHVNRDGKF